MSWRWIRDWSSLFMYLANCYYQSLLCHSLQRSEFCSALRKCHHWSEDFFNGRSRCFVTSAWQERVWLLLKFTTIEDFVSNSFLACHPEARGNWFLHLNECWITQWLFALCWIELLQYKSATQHKFNSSNPDRQTKKLNTHIYTSCKEISKHHAKRSTGIWHYSKRTEPPT